MDAAVPRRAAERVDGGRSEVAFQQRLPGCHGDPDLRRDRQAAHGPGVLHRLARGAPQRVRVRSDERVRLGDAFPHLWQRRDRGDHKRSEVLSGRSRRRARPGGVSSHQLRRRAGRRLPAALGGHDLARGIRGARPRRPESASQPLRTAGRPSASGRSRTATSRSATRSTTATTTSRAGSTNGTRPGRGSRSPTESGCQTGSTRPISTTAASRTTTTTKSSPLPLGRFSSNSHPVLPPGDPMTSRAAR